MQRAISFLFLALLANTAYVAAFATASIFYMANVLLHVGLGFALVLLGRRYLPSIATGLFAVAVLSAAWLMWKGALYEYRPILWVHILSAVAGTLAVAWHFGGRFRAAVLAGLAATGLLPIIVRAIPDQQARITNPLIVPLSMEEEGGGPKSPFWPSSSKTNVGGTIPSNFFMDSKLCGECHKDIYDQWNSSVHHFASFNNQFYRKSIEQMQAVSGSTQGSKWCAACHDHAVFFNGRFEKPIKDQIDTPEAQTGLGCVSCHSITHVDSTMGNAGFTIEYPPLHQLLSSRNKFIRAADTFLTYLNPEPHRRTFLKPFMKDSSEFCSTCHKVHLDVPVNNYRWIRGFNDYDNWQASGVSGQGARSFYYPQQSSTCSACHMPMVDSKDPGNRGGKIHSHRFPAANMAVAYANRDEVQMKETEKFLKSGFMSVDIFAVSPVKDASGPVMKRRQEVPQLMSTLAVGEEAEQSGQVFLREVGEVSAPMNTAGSAVEPGSTARVDVVVRTRKIGHFFPGGTVDAFDVWLELQGTDADGRIIYWSGAAEDGGKGPVEKGAHFYRSYQLDGAGNPVNKRNAWQTRSVLYVRLIPPGAADVAHFRIQIPKDAKGPITLRAKLNYRKFAHYYTQYAYAGEPVGGVAAKDHDSREYSFTKTNIPKNVSGSMKDEIPDVPTVTIAEVTSELKLGTAKWTPVVRKEDRERWNDWGIGMLLQGDLKGAEYAFLKVTEAEPGYADGWLNVARALIQEGENERAKQFLDKAMALNPKLARIHFFKAMTQKTDGDYDGALGSLRTAAEQYPRDRVVQNQIGRVLFLQRKYADAVEALKRVLAVDPEDLQAHYNLMLAYRGLGDGANAAREEKLFRRFKTDESAQEITAKQRLVSAEDNNERQAIHEHENAVKR